MKVLTKTKLFSLKQPYRLLRLLCISLAFSVFIYSCGEKLTKKEKLLKKLPKPKSTLLIQGKEIWIENCYRCHGTGLAHAPIIMDKQEWESRIAQGLETLFDHAINGFDGKGFEDMPARGGKENLTDDEVKAAVSFMVEASK